ncbi:MAG: hypothetical protein HY587_08110 [Candidatus Omnitrophica bacterium]|nr:hypothetical protein [Candidatus Omnitrophota bacterium]
MSATGTGSLKNTAARNDERQMQGSMSRMKCENPRAYERARYIRALQMYKFT